MWISAIDSLPEYNEVLHVELHVMKVYFDFLQRVGMLILEGPSNLFQVEVTSRAYF